MDILNKINIITVLMVCMFVVPILVGIIRPLTNDRIHRSFTSLLSNLLFLASIVLSIYLTSIILSSDAVLTGAYKIIPALRNAVENHYIWVYIILFISLLLIADGILHLLTIPIYRYVFTAMADSIASAISSMNSFARRIIGGLWKLPKSLWLVLVFSILLSLLSGYFNSSPIIEYAKSSTTYQLVQENVVQPLLNNSTVQNIQVIFNNSFQTAEDEFSNIKNRYLIRYFNGVTLDEAVKSSPDIDAKAKEIVGSETDDRRKAYLIYQWITENVTYDNGKATIISTDPSSVSSGAIVAYNTRTGVCFDYSCLYVAMCRAVDLNVRFLTGLGYTGIEWGDHAWNQAYDSKQGAWINVDTTFGSSGINYFDKASFYLDHKDGVIQGEW
jgi:hypothetical protein